MNGSRKIGLFGGTFDPVHLGHIHLADVARQVMALDEVRFIPCQISPHKTGTHPASPADRAAMLEIATRDLPWAVVDDIELTSREPNYSYLTAGKIAEAHPGNQLYWIMGGDQWNALHTWKHPEKLAALVEFIVLARNDAPAPRQGYRMHLATGEHAGSSTAIRNGKDAHLHPEVLSYIRRHGLYSR